MKYLMQNRKEFVITCGVFATFLLVIFWSIWSIIHNNFDYKNLIAIIGAIFEFCGWYYNMPTSKENCEHTGMMRLEKQYNKSGQSDGEDFFTEKDPVETEDEIIDLEEEGDE